MHFISDFLKFLQENCNGRNDSFFFTFIFRRQEIWHKRSVLKQSAPWSDDEIFQIFKMQKEAFEFLKKEQGLDWETVRWQNPEYPNAPYLCLHDIQNSLCEFRKYWRLKSGEKAKKRYFKPQN